MKFWLIGMLVSAIWIAIEMYRAPGMDDYGNITKEGKKLKDLFKRKK